MAIHIEQPKCIAGCNNYTGGEIKHHADCPFYPESLSKMFDDTLNTLAKVLEREAQTDNFNEITEPKTHDTFLIGFNSDRQIIFFKSYRWATQKNIADFDFNWVTKKENCDHWEYGHTSCFKIWHEHEAFQFNIPMP